MLNAEYQIMKQFSSPGVQIFWLMLLIHIIGGFICLLRIIGTSDFIKIVGVATIGGYIFHAVLLFYVPNATPCTLDYRYIAWVWAGWALLYGNVVNEKSRLSYFFKRLLIIGIIIQVYTLMVLK